MFCSNCGKKIDEDTKFCPECGNPIKLNDVEETDYSDEEEDDQVSQEETAESSSENYVIRDWKRIGATLLMAALWWAWTYAHAISKARSTEGLAFCGGFAIFFTLCFINAVKGFRIDTQNYILKYHIWGIFPSKIDITKIQQIQTSEEVSVKNNYSGHSTIIRTYYLLIVGTFGSRKLKFYSEGACMRVYAAISEMNDMGIPIV